MRLSVLDQSTSSKGRTQDVAIRETLAGAGVSEVVTSALVAPDDPVRFGARDDGELAREPEQRSGGGVVTVTNPLSSQHSVLRQSLQLRGVVREHARAADTELPEHRRGCGVVAPVDGKAEREVGVHGVEPVVLQRVRADLVE